MLLKVKKASAVAVLLIALVWEMFGMVGKADARSLTQQTPQVVSVNEARANLLSGQF